MNDYIKNYIKDSILTREKLLQDEKTIFNIEEAARVITNAFMQNKKVLLAGNGGSAADAQHIAGELVVKFHKERHALPATALTVDSSIMTAIGNDFGYDFIFSKQIEAYGNPNDIFIAISTSGESPNIVEALKTAKSKGLQTIGLLGAKSCSAEKYCDIAIKVPSKETPKIQELHTTCGHIICGLVEENFN